MKRKGWDSSKERDRARGKKGEGEGKGRNLGDQARGTHRELEKEAKTVLWGKLCAVPKGLS